MKKLFLFATLAAAALLAGCVKNEIGVPDAPVTHISARAVSAESPETKAPLAGTSLDGKQAQIFSITSPLNAYAGDKTKMFTNAYARGTMTFKDNSYSQYDLVGLSGGPLLPIDKSDLYLYGFYPTGWTISCPGTYERLSRTFDGKTDLMATWVIPADQQKIAYKGGASGATPDKADLLFRHLLTRYNVQVKCSSANVLSIWGRIKSIKLKNADIDQVSTGENFGYIYSAGGSGVSCYKMGGTIAVPTYSDDLFEQTAFADMLPLTTTYANACYTMAAPVDVDASPATAELTLVIETLDKDGGTNKLSEIPLSLDRAKLTAAVLANNTCGYSINIALNFRAGTIDASAVVEAWKDGSDQTEQVRPPVPIPEIGDLKDDGIVYWVDPDNSKYYKVFSLDQGSSLKWSATGFYGVGTAGQSATDGQANVAAMKAYSANTGANSTTGVFATDFPAAGFCEAKNTDGVTDWYLPAKDELKALYDAYRANKTLLDGAITTNSGTAMGNDTFWSSTEYNYAYAWFTPFSDGAPSTLDKSSSSTVRCVRSTVPIPPKIGDLKDSGIVYEVTDASHYKVFSLDQGSSLKWSALGSYELGSGDGQDETDGRKNVAAMKKYMTDHSLTDFSAAFPAAAFCDAKNTGGVTGWYLPSKDELTAFSVAYGPNRTLFDPAITENLGTAMSQDIFWSGTEYSGSTTSAYFVDFSTSYTDYKRFKEQTSYVRCIKKIDGQAPTLPEPELNVAVGDLKGGGIVFWVSRDKTHYRIVYSQPIDNHGMWSGKPTYAVGCIHEDDGRVNVAKMEAYSRNHVSDTNDATRTTGVFATDFPMASWCKAFSTSETPVGQWYMPAYNEMVEIHKQMHLLTPKGYVFDGRWAMTSSEMPENLSKVYYSEYGSTMGTWEKTTSDVTRCIAYY